MWIFIEHQLTKIVCIWLSQAFFVCVFLKGWPKLNWVGCLYISGIVMYNLFRLWRSRFVHEISWCAITRADRLLLRACFSGSSVPSGGLSTTDSYLQSSARYQVVLSALSRQQWSRRLILPTAYTVALTHSGINCPGCVFKLELLSSKRQRIV